MECTSENFLLRRKISRNASECDSAFLSVVHLLKMMAHDTSENANKMISTDHETGPASKISWKGFSAGEVSMADGLISCKS